MEKEKETYEITAQDRNAILNWLTKGEGRNLSYGNVSAVVALFQQLKKIENENSDKNTESDITE